MYKFILSSALLICLLAQGSVSAQKLFHETYSWEESPKPQKIDSADQTFPAVFIRDFKVLEFNITASSAEMYTTEHQVIHLNTDAGIEKYNKVYIPLRANQTLLDLKVRSISPDGKVTLFKQENLKQLQSPNGFNNFKIFAVEGASVGGEIEYLYTLKGQPLSAGTEIVQGEIPIKHYSFMIVAPERIKWDFKTYNGIPKAFVKPLDLKKNALALEIKDVAALANEQYSAYQASLGRIEFRLKSAGKSDKSLTWEDVSQRLLSTIYDAKGESKVEKIIKQLKFANQDDETIVLTLENYIKANFSLKEGASEDYEDLRDIVAKRVANERGMIKLYIACLKKLNINNQLVLGDDRFRNQIDQDFPSFRGLSNFLIYFPKLNKYLAPDAMDLRLGAAPVAVDKALFIAYYYDEDRLSLTNFSIKPVTPLDYSHNGLGVKASVTFKEEMDAPEVKAVNYYQGYRGFSMRGAYSKVLSNRKEDFMKAIVLSGIDNPNIIQQSIKGTDVALSAYPDSAITITTLYTASSLLERAGDDYIFALGKLIGRQSELYQEKERKTDIEFREIANYNHEISVAIPLHYSVSGLDKIKMHHEVRLEGKVVMQFTSDYEMANGLLVVKISEFYKVIHLPKEKYNEFRSVVNASADFNKLAIVLSKEK